MLSVLLTDGQQRKTLAAARSLGQAGHRVLVADETRFSTSRFSRFCRQGLVSPPPNRTEDYWQWLLAVKNRQRPDVLLPMDDQTTALAVARQDRLPYLTLLPTPEQYAACQDKVAIAALARQTGVRAPRTLGADSLAEAEAAARTLGWPVVVKARVSSGGRGIFFVSDPTQLRQAWQRSRPEWGGFLVQERIPTGRKFDVCLLYDRDGRLRTHFVQEELRFFPLEYGPSTLQESVHRPDLVALSERLLAPVGWRGPVEVEFMAGPDGEPVLMEVNPRYWASLALAIRCGIDFPRLTVKLAAGGPGSPPVPTAYPAGVRCRWLLPGDILHFLANPQRWRMQPGFFSTYDERTFDDILSWRDPGPVLGFVLAVGRYVFDPGMWRLLLRW